MASYSVLNVFMWNSAGGTFIHPLQACTLLNHQERKESLCFKMKNARDGWQQEHQKAQTERQEHFRKASFIIVSALISPLRKVP